MHVPRSWTERQVTSATHAVARAVGARCAALGLPEGGLGVRAFVALHAVRAVAEMYFIAERPAVDEVDMRAELRELIARYLRAR